MKDALFTGFWISLLTGSITWGATYSLGYGLAAFLVGFLAFGVGPALYDEGKAHESKETADILAQKPKTGADLLTGGVGTNAGCSPRPCRAGA